MMRASLRALLSEIIDYAGLFPPASLSLDEAIRNYARYRDEPESWMLSRFICPARRLHELPAFRHLFNEREPLRLSVLVGSAGETLAEYARIMKDDLKRLSDFRTESESWTRIEAQETRGPDESPRQCTGEERPGEGVSFLGTTLDQHWPIYLEQPLTDDWRSSLERALDSLSHGNHSLELGLKLRTGGLAADAFPSCEKVAFVIQKCRDAGVPLKFTAGLHHPLRHYNLGVQTHMHGFLNVFVAGILAHTHGLAYQDILAILEEQDVRQFTFTDEFLGWNEIEASVDEVRKFRERRVISFGSCSFDEPREDLRALGLL